MKTMAVAALAALLAVAQTATAQQGDPLAEERAARADGDALITMMRANARMAREILEQARSRKRPDEIRCSDEALSRADVALRRGREDAAAMVAALSGRDPKTATEALYRLRARAAASRDAAGLAGQCIAKNGRAPDRTQVIVHVSPAS